MNSIVTELKKPCGIDWLFEEITTLLSHYYIPNMGEGQLGAVLSSWARALNSPPEWAVKKACRFWISRQNPDRHRRPVPGDIEELIHEEMAFVRMAEKHMLVEEASRIYLDPETQTRRIY